LAALACDLLAAVVLVRGPASEDLPLLSSLADALREHAAGVFIAMGDQRRHPTWADEQISFSAPPVARRKSAWSAALADLRVPCDPTTVELLAERFRLNAGEIAKAARNVVGAAEPSLEDALVQSTRAVSRADLGPLARHVTSHFDWDDLILPAAARRRLQGVAAAIEHRDLVFQQWGFGRRRMTSRGLTILFSGPSGTGKTMAASVIARLLGFDLFKIDLSAVVSKYIGETEKNLQRIFSAAHSEDALLFFDEADALFGKRSEVKEAHDRFANIEIAYLLQELEEHDGVVILATNLSSNIDDAF
jgi:hypothetical protein